IMTVNSMIDDFLGPAPRAPRELEDTASHSGDGVSKALRKVATYIPAEVVATYIPLVSLLRELNDHLWQWAAFWIFLVATPFTVWVTFAVKVKQRKRRGQLKKEPPQPWWPIGAATISFTAWAIALPGSVMNDLAWFRPSMGAVAILIAAFVVGLLS